MGFEPGDAVVARGKLKKVIEFLADADKETLRILASFFENEAKGPTDAKRFKKPMLVKNVYNQDGTVEVELSKNYLWEEKQDYFEKADDEQLKSLLKPKEEEPMS